MIPTIILVEDNKELVEFVKDLFKSSGEYNVIGFTSGIEGLKYIRANKPNMVIIDLFLEDIHGKTICEETRKLYNDIPIIILTGDKSSDSLVECMNKGADDYITKPFDSEEFMARINSKMRNVLNNSKSNVLSCDDLELNTQTFQVKRGKDKIDLTTKEFELLHYLLLNKFRVCTRDKILFSVWGYTSEVETRVVDVHIGKLRKKLDTKNKEYIKSIRGYGYKMCDEDE